MFLCWLPKQDPWIWANKRDLTRPNSPQRVCGEYPPNHLISGWWNIMIHLDGSAGFCFVRTSRSARSRTSCATPASARLLKELFPGSVGDFPTGLGTKHVGGPTRRSGEQGVCEPLGPPARCPFSPTFWGEGSPTKIDYRKRGTLILTSTGGGASIHVEGLFCNILEWPRSMTPIIW